MKIFVIVSRIPYPLEKGDKLRAFHQIKELSKQHEIYLCALSDRPVHKDAIKTLSEFCKKIEVIRLHKLSIYFNMLIRLLFTNTSLQVAYFYNKKAHQKIKNLVTEIQPDHIYCQLIRVSEYVKDFSIKKTLDYMDALARGMERRIEEAPFYLKPFLKIETLRLKRYEHQIFDYFDNITIISKQDRDLIVNAYNHNIVVVPNGVDYSKYHFKDLPKVYDLVFTGNMGYPPNVNSVLYLVKKIMPLLWQQNPDIKLVIAGANPHPKIQALKSKNVIVTGWVEDITTYYAQSKIFIAPMQIGTGLQNKLLEAMAIKLPCITSELANNALGATHNENILIGHTPEDYAQLVFELLNNPEKAKKIAENGYRFVKENYTWEGSTAILENLIVKTSIN